MRVNRFQPQVFLFRHNLSILVRGSGDNPYGDNAMNRPIAAALALSTFFFMPQESFAVPVIVTSNLNIQFNNVVDPISDDYVALYNSCTPGPCSFQSVEALSPIPVGNSDQIVSVPAGYDGIAFLGVYNASSGAAGLTIGVDS